MVAHAFEMENEEAEEEWDYFVGTITLVRKSDKAVWIKFEDKEHIKVSQMLVASSFHITEPLSHCLLCLVQSCQQERYGSQWLFVEPKPKNPKNSTKEPKDSTQEVPQTAQEEGEEQVTTQEVPRTAQEEGEEEVMQEPGTSRSPSVFAAIGRIVQRMIDNGESSETRPKSTRASTRASAK